MTAVATDIRAARTAAGEIIVVDRLPFRSRAEVAVYQALRAIQEEEATRRPFDGLALTGNVPIKVAGGRTFEADLLVMSGGRVIAVEVDGAVHDHRWAEDRLKDQCLKDGGLADVERLPGYHTLNPAELDAFIRRVLHDLGRR